MNMFCSYIDSFLVSSIKENDKTDSKWKSEIELDDIGITTAVRKVKIRNKKIDSFNHQFQL